MSFAMYSRSAVGCSGVGGLVLAHQSTRLHHRRSTASSRRTVVTATLAVPQTDSAEGASRCRPAAGKTDRGLLDGDHLTGRVPTAEVRVGAEKAGAGGSNEGTGGPSRSASRVGSVGFIDRGFLPPNPYRFGQCNV